MSCLTIVEQNAGRSDGDRLVIQISIDDDFLVDDFGAGVA